MWVLLSGRVPTEKIHRRLTDDVEGPTKANLIRAAAFCAVFCALIAAPGCSSTKWAKLRGSPDNALTQRLARLSKGELKPTPRTVQSLRVCALEEEYKKNPEGAIAELENLVRTRPSADLVYSLAELCYIRGKGVEEKDPQAAGAWYGASLGHAYQYLFDQRFSWLRNPYDPQFREACDVYNGSLEAALRLVCARNELKPNRVCAVETGGKYYNILCLLRNSRWKPEDIHHFEFASDYEVDGLANQYRTYGLGVPLIAVRERYEGQAPEDRYYPPQLSFPMTAFFRPLDKSRTSLPYDAVLELYDPVAGAETRVDALTVPLESDSTTPLAYALSNPVNDKLATLGLLFPEFLTQMQGDAKSPIMGLYMLEPYEPGKIPVLMVHGLWSSPMTWMQMYNDLRNAPEIRAHYQFWFYYYPTGQPFLISAAQLRRDLKEMRATFDPGRHDPALDQMVLIGHSMGGLVSRLQTIHSGDEFWSLVSDRPFSELKAQPEVRENLAKLFFFEPNPSVRRVVTIGTPHRGSDVSNNFTQWLTAKLVRLPTQLVSYQQELYRENKDILKDDALIQIQTSVDTLDPAYPVFPAMLEADKPPWVRYHNIVGEIPQQSMFTSFLKGSDGVVSYESAHMEDVVSEIVVSADHTSIHTRPHAIVEVRRILLEHLAELRSAPYPLPKP